MTLGLAFWIIMLIWLVIGGVGFTSTPGPWYGWGGHLMLFILLLLLGWHAFGAPLHN